MPSCRRVLRTKYKSKENKTNKNEHTATNLNKNAKSQVFMRGKFTFYLEHLGQVFFLKKTPTLSPRFPGIAPRTTRMKGRNGEQGGTPYLILTSIETAPL